MNVLTLNHKVIGHGPNMIMLHGWQRNLNDLLSFAELFHNSSTIHLIDLPGFGDSPLPEQDWNTTDYAKRVLLYMDQNKLTKVDLFGHSFGGRVAIRLASTFPSRVRSLTLMGTPGLPIRRYLSQRVRLQFIKSLVKTSKLLDATLGTQIFHKEIAPRFGSRDYLQAGPLRNILIKAVNEDLSEAAAKIQAETLLIWGDCDNEAPLEIALAYKEIIPKAKLIVLPNRGHDCYKDVDGHLSAYYLKQFLETLENR